MDLESQTSIVAARGELRTELGILEWKQRAADENNDAGGGGIVARKTEESENAAVRNEDASINGDGKGETRHCSGIGGGAEIFVGGGWPRGRECSKS